VSRRATRAGTGGGESDGRPAAALRPNSQPPDGSIQAHPPEPATPFWRAVDGSRQSYPEAASALREAHLAAIGQIAAAALQASERSDHGETIRLASAAARLCGEIRGLWTPSAVEIPKR
jgi:hypothetical protein